MKLSLNGFIAACFIVTTPLYGVPSALTMLLAENVILAKSTPIACTDSSVALKLLNSPGVNTISFKSKTWSIDTSTRRL